MIGRYGILYLVIALSTSCSTHTKSTSEENPVISDWTSCLNSSGFEEITLSKAINLPDGRIEETSSIYYLNDTELLFLQELTIAEGQIRELRITIEGSLGVSLDSVYYDLQARLNTLYGLAMPTEAYSTWRAATSGQTLMEIELMDARPLFQRDEILVHWKEHADKLYED